MTHYSNDPSMVQVEFFKPSGKWYTTEAVKWLTWKGDPSADGKLIHDAFKEALDTHFGDNHRLRGMWAVCFDPYHENSHPIMMVVE